MNTAASLQPYLAPLIQPIVNLPVTIPPDLAATLMSIIFPIANIIPQIPILGPIILDIMPAMTGLIH